MMAIDWRIAAGFLVTLALIAIFAGVGVAALCLIGFVLVALVGRR
jgi:hypothetical protein